MVFHLPTCPLFNGGCVHPKTQRKRRRKLYKNCFPDNTPATQIQTKGIYFNFETDSFTDHIDGIGLGYHKVNGTGMYSPNNSLSIGISYFS